VLAVAEHEKNRALNVAAREVDGSKRKCRLSRSSPRGPIHRRHRSMVVNGNVRVVVYIVAKRRDGPNPPVARDKSTRPVPAQMAGLTAKIGVRLVSSTRNDTDHTDKHVDEWSKWDNDRVKEMPDTLLTGILTTKQRKQLARDSVKEIFTTFLKK
jgi:hypothetical protein